MAAPTTIHLIRHAQSRPSLSAHHSEWPLSDVGRSQAVVLAGLLLGLQIEKVFSSPYLRCLETIRPLLESEELPLAVDDDLRERLITETFVDGFEQVWKRSWDDFRFAVAGCENSESAQRRFGAAVSGIAGRNPGAILGISSHGNVIGLLLNRIDGEFHREATEALRNPDVIRVVAEAGVFHWDREFRLQGLDAIATHHSATPLPKRA